MDDLIGVIIMLVIGGIGLYSRAHRKQQAGQRQSAPVGQQSAQKRQAGPVSLGSAFQLLLEQVERQAESARSGVAPKQARPAPGAEAEGESLADAYGCEGGSMPHDTHEGEEFPGHEHRTGASMAVGRAPETEIPAPVAAPRRDHLTPSQMKNAVVMAEVLGRPVSMRKGGVRQ